MAAILSGGEKLTLDVLNFPDKTLKKYICYFNHEWLSEHCDGAGCQNHSLWMIMTCLSYTVNNMVTDDKVTQWARISVAKVVDLVLAEYSRLCTRMVEFPIHKIAVLVVNHGIPNTIVLDIP